MEAKKWYTDDDLRDNKIMIVMTTLTITRKSGKVVTSFVDIKRNQVCLSRSFNTRNGEVWVGWKGGGERRRKERF